MNDPAEIKKLIEEAEVITIWGHALPDGDCYGCQMGLKTLIILGQSFVQQILQVHME